MRTSVPPDGGGIILGAPERSLMRAIDIHAHLTPQCFWRATENGGDWHTLRREKDAQGTEVALVGSYRQPLPLRARWTPEERLADMDSLGVDVHVVSPYVGFYNYHLDTKVAVATSRATNDEISEMVRARPQRFAGLGTLPMQDVKSAIAELERCMTRLGMKGAEINDHVNGRTFDDPEFRPFFKAAEQMGATIFFHQSMETLVTPRSRRYHLPNSIGNLVDRAVTFATLVHVRQPPSAYLRRFYYDCIVYTEEALRYLIDTVGVDRVVFGTDWPYDMVFDWPVSWILSLENLTQDEKEAILWKNLERLLGL